MHTRWVRLPLAALLALVVGSNAVAVIDYMRTPRYTYLAMATDIKQQIAASQRPDGLIMGDIANSLSLATGQRSINATWGTRDAGWKLARYNPAFYVTLGQDRATRAIVEADYDLILLGTYDVFDNYYQREQVYFYAIQPRANDGRPRSKGEQS